MDIPHRTPHAQDRPRLLVLEQDRDRRERTLGMLEALGYAPEPADSDEAVARCRIEPPAALVVGVERPDAQAVLAVRRLQRRGHLPEFPVIGMAPSADDDPPPAVDGVVPHPLRVTTLAVELARHLGDGLERPQDGAAQDVP